MVRPLGLSPDSAFLYAPGVDDDTIVALARQIPASCKDATTSTRSNRAVNVLLDCVDLNGDPITRAIASQPANGTLGNVDQALGNVQYTPKTNFSGTDTFTFVATDGGELPSNVATATITVSDTVATNCTVRTKRARLSKLKKGAAIFKLRCKEAGTAFAELLARRRPAGRLGLLSKVRRTKIGAGKKAATGAGTVRVRVKVPSPRAPGPEGAEPAPGQAAQAEPARAVRRQLEQQERAQAHQAQAQALTPGTVPRP